MKSKEQWAAELIADKHPHTLHEKNIIAFVQLIQLDAYKAGMTAALDVIDRTRLHAEDQQWPHTVQDMHRLHTIILTERDQLKEIPQQ